MPKLYLINGPNLNMLGLREPEIYGYETLSDLESRLEKLSQGLGHELICFQSNHEGQIIDYIHENYSEISGLVINPGGLTHTSVSLRDAVSILNCPVIEVHISDIDKREAFRKHSFLSDIVSETIKGEGISGYERAIRMLNEELND